MNIDIITLSLWIVSWYYIDRDMEFDDNGTLCGGIEIGTILMHCYILHCHSIVIMGFKLKLKTIVLRKELFL